MVSGGATGFLVTMLADMSCVCWESCVINVDGRRANGLLPLYNAVAFCASAQDEASDCTFQNVVVFGILFPATAVLDLLKECDVLQKGISGARRMCNRPRVRDVSLVFAPAQMMKWVAQACG